MTSRAIEAFSRLHCGQVCRFWLRSPLDYIIAVAITMVALLLYILTLAPTVVWGDDATLQLAAVRGDLHASAGSHPAWIALAHLFTRIPVGEPAYRVNLAAAFAAASAIGVLFLACRTLHVSRPASAAATVAWMVSHTFWAHAVRPETYALTMATLAIVVWLTLRWYQFGQVRDLVFLGVAWGAAITTHLLTLLYMPAILWLLMARRQLLRLRTIIVFVCGTLIALLPLGWLLWRDAQTFGMGWGEALRWAVFTFEGYDFSQQMFRWSLVSLPSDLGQWFLYLGYQFVGPAFLLGVIGCMVSWHRLPSRLAFFVVLLYGFSVSFAFSYQVGDRYVFYLPSYLAFMIWVALGADSVLLYLEKRVGRIMRLVLTSLLLILTLAVPVITYRVTPDLMQQANFTFREGRYVPGPNSRYFVLWPPKAGYYDARNYAEAVLDHMPENGVLFADPILATPIIYLQKVEGRREDISVLYCCWEIESILQSYEGRPLALADVYPEIYPVSRLTRDFVILSDGPVYKLIHK